MKRFIAVLFLSMALFGLAGGVAQAQLKNNLLNPPEGKSKFSASKIFGDVYETGAGGLEQNLPAAVGSIIGAFLGFVGVILLVIVVYAGYLWLTAGGNDEQVSHAKQLIKNGVIGMAITLSAYVITSFVVDQLSSALNQTQQAGGGAAAPARRTNDTSDPVGGDAGPLLDVPPSITNPGAETTGAG